MEGPSGNVKGVGPSPQAVDPSSSPEVAVISSSLGIMIPIDNKALMARRSCHDCDSTITIQCLTEFPQHSFVPREYELHVSLPSQHPYDSFLDNFGLSIDAFEAGLRFLLHPMIEAYLDEVKGRSASHLTNQPTPPPTEGASTRAVEMHPTTAGEKCPTEGGSEPLRKSKKMAQKPGNSASSQDEAWGSILRRGGATGPRERN
ncbi:hypothetical protein GW17_00029031 [Ensete ventricosum]|nr:hypothetical protein GW17_00029031 [Ensete ventricosum]